MTTETERWKGLCRKVTEALNRRSAEYEESQRELAFARNELACKCAEVDGLEWQVEELRADAIEEFKTIMGPNSAVSEIQAENEKLIVKLNAEHIARQNVEVENAKLRELVREMHATISDRNSWWDCTYKDTRRFADRMRELGVEVG